MLNIKEIAERVSKRIYVEDGLLLSKFISEKFAEAFIAEIAKQNKPVAWCVGYDDPRMGRIHANPTMCKPEAEALVKSTTSELIVCSLYALPPTAEQIANETDEVERLKAALTQFLDQEGNPPEDTGEWRFVLQVLGESK